MKFGVGGAYSFHSPISLANKWFWHGPFSLPKDGRKTRALFFLYLGHLALGPPLAVRTRPLRAEPRASQDWVSQENPDFPIYRQAVTFWSSICLTPDLPQSAVEKRKRVMARKVRMLLDVSHKSFDLNLKET